MKNMADVAGALWVLYNYDAEAFDRTVPHTPSPHHPGVVIPHPGRPMRLSRANARRLHERTREQGRKLGLDPAAMERARREVMLWPHARVEDSYPWAVRILGQQKGLGVSDG